jgi:starch synthase
MRDKRFGIHPHIVVTNDWMTGLVPAYLQTDPRYVADPLMKGIETVHIIHNGGRDYQGRISTNFFGEDLFPILGIGPAHFFGLSDPKDRTCLNVTAGALFHVRKGILAVSKPYAAQLLTRDGGEGLEELFRKRRDIVFGISNGIDLDSLRRIFWELGEKARQSLELPAVGSSRYHEKRLLKQLPYFKQSLKAVVQKKYGLNVDSHALLLCLISRLAEQKGITLLTDNTDAGISSLEAVLMQSPDVQIFIGGPSNEGDPVVGKLREVVADLKERYPGRVNAEFDFILHKDALEITQASDLFLMPSRYEPGGITQLEALAAGTLVIARNVGGISATLQDYNHETREGNSFLFHDYTSDALYEKVCQAIDIMRPESKRFELMHKAALSQHDWSYRAPKYLALFQYISGVLRPQNIFPHLAKETSIVDAIRP